MNISFYFNTDSPTLAAQVEGKLQEILDIVEVVALADAENKTSGTMQINNSRVVGRTNVYGDLVGIDAGY